MSHSATNFNPTRITSRSAGLWIEWFAYAAANGYATDIAKQYAVNRGESGYHSHGGFQHDHHAGRYNLPRKGRVRIWERPFAETLHGACSPALFDRVMRPHFCDWLGVNRDIPLGVLVDHSQHVRDNPGFRQARWDWICSALLEEWNSGRPDAVQIGVVQLPVHFVEAGSIRPGGLVHRRAHAKRLWRRIETPPDFVIPAWQHLCPAFTRQRIFFEPEDGGMWDYCWDNTRVYPVS